MLTDKQIKNLFRAAGNSSAKLLNKIGMIADYVVEIGADVVGTTTWHWVKYASGRCELTGNREGTFTSAEWGASGANTYYANAAGAGFPFELVELYSSDMTAWNSSGYMVWTLSYPSASYAAPSTTYTGYFALGRLLKPTSSLVFKITYKVTGMWKLGGGNT